MSTEDFASNNEESSQFTAGRGLRNRAPTAAIAQYKEGEAKKAASRTRRIARLSVADAGSTSLADTHTPQTPQAATAGPSPLADAFADGGGPQWANQSFSSTQQAPIFPPTPDHTFLPFQNDYYHLPQHSSSPSPFQSTATFPIPNPGQWDCALQNHQLFTINGGAVQFPAAATVPFNPEEEDEMYADPEADFPDPSVLLAVDQTPSTLQDNSPTLGPETIPTPVRQQLSTPQNLRVFPQETPSMTSTSVTLPRRTLIRRVRPATSSIPSTQSTPSQAPAPQPSSVRLPLIHRTNLFGPGYHEDRQRPRASPQVTHTSVAHIAHPVAQKENLVHLLSSDEEQDPPPKKKSFRAAGSRSIRQLDADRIPVVEAGYPFVDLMVMTDSKTTWLNDRAGIAVLADDAFDHGLVVLKKDGRNFGPLSVLEQDLYRQHLYGTRSDFKVVAHDVFKGDDGYDLRSCSSKATKEQQAVVAAHNRAEVAILMDRSAFVFADPHNRKAKGTLYQHASIEKTVIGVVFDGLLSYGMQHPEFLDDTSPKDYDADDETQPPHKPTFSLVAINLAINAIRAAIMEYSSGHFVSEVYSRKIYNPLFDEELKTLRAWHTYTSNPTKIEGDGPVRKQCLLMEGEHALTLLPSFLLTIGLRYAVLKDVVAPVPSTAVMDESDFAGNQ
ncbi:hypothetical protein C8R44DRAFT_861043 [Mycena epipterygia]|nr:hypothetical protein C8R44DRAFT_861043 [Mycena epipterygia]